MKTQVIVGKALAASAFAALASAAIAACSSDPQETGQGGSSSVQSSASSVASTGEGGGAPDASVSPLAGICNDLCGYLSSISCEAWSNCSTECVNGFNAPPDCQDEVKALLECWLGKKMEFTCSKTQLIPPKDCQPLEAAFNECFTGSGTGDDGGTGGGCAPTQLKNSTETTCSAKTQCGNNTPEEELETACALQDMGSMTWACSCYRGETLLGTCSATDNVCENHAGCCAPFFFKGAK